MKIIIITSVRNEEKYIRYTLESLVAQTLLPVKWIIVDDGSTDKTSEIIKEFMLSSSFIEYVHIRDRGFRKPAEGVIESFYEGHKRIRNSDYEILAKLDGDLKLPSNALEKISKAFQENPKLGITGGTRYEQLYKNGPVKRGIVSVGFVGGPHKFYRKQCFEDINGLISRAGWDGVDTIKANMKGWETGEIQSLKIFHLKPTGLASGEGLKKSCEKYGNIGYYMGGYFWYFILRTIRRSLQNRNPKSGLYMIKGYLNSMNNHIVREQGDFRKYLKKNQIQNMIHWIKTILNFKESEII